MKYYDIDKDIFSRGCNKIPRQARLDTHRTLHHVIIRGIEKKHIVDDVKDKKGLFLRQGVLEFLPLLYLKLLAVK